MKWTQEKLQEEANKYENRREFRKNSPAAYNYTIKNKLTDELFKKHINKGYDINKQKFKNYWNYKNLQIEVNKYETRGIFQKENGSAYNSARRLNIIDELFKKHTNKGFTKNRKIKNYWTFKKLQIVVDKYDNRKEFRNKNYAAYSAAKRMKLIDKLFIKHNNNGYINNKEWEYFKYVIYVYELPNYNKAYVGLTNNIKRRDQEHIFNKKELLTKFIEKNDLPYPKYKILEIYLTSKDTRNKEKYWLNYYKNNNWEMFNIQKTGSLGAASKKWTKKALQVEANKFYNILNFRENNKKAYWAASRKKIINELFKNHKNNGYSRQKNYYWTFEKLQIEANKYDTRTSFSKNNNAAYSAAQKMKLIGNLFENHKNNGYKYKKS